MLSSAWTRFRSWPIWVQVSCWVVAGLLVIGPFVSEDAAGPAATADSARSADPLTGPDKRGSAEPITPTTIETPDVEGMSLTKAKSRIEGDGLDYVISKKYSKQPAGTIINVVPGAGTEVEEGATISLFLARPYPEVPFVIGMSTSKAVSSLKAADYRVTTVQQVSSSPAGTVISQSPGSGQQLLPGDSVKIVVAKEAPAPTAPSRTPGYSPCLEPASDYDCGGGSGDGPKYVNVTVIVTGSDPYGLDSDNDGYGCE